MWLRLPRRPALVQAEFERNLPFARSVADSAVDPADPKTVTGITTKPFYVDSDDPYKRGNPGVRLSFTKSYGDPQPVAVIAKRSLGDVEVKYRINSGDVQTRRAHVRVGGRVEVQPGVGLLPPDARRGDRHRPRRLGRGLVRGWRPAE